MFTNLKKRISFLVLLTFLVLSFSVECFAAEANSEAYYISSENGLYLRSGPSKDYDVIATIPYGAQIEVIDTSNQYWYKISYSSQTGYVSSKYITTQKPSGSTASVSESEASAQTQSSDTDTQSDSISISTILNEIKEVAYIFLIGFLAIILLVITITVIKKKNAKKHADLDASPFSADTFEDNTSDDFDDEYDDDEYDLSYDSSNTDDEIDDDE